MKSKSYPLPDVAFVGYPPIEAAAVMLRWLNKNNIPSIIDVKDQWPSLFLEPFPKYLSPIIKLLLIPYFYYGKRALRDATAFSTMSQAYLNWMSIFSGRKLHDMDTVVPLTTPKSITSQKDLIEAQNWWSERGISLINKRRFCFIGSFMSIFDFSVIREVASRFQKDGIDCQFVICGDGGSADNIKSMMAGLHNVLFPGWIDEPKIFALAKCSSGSLIPYKNIENFILNTPNKVIDALAYGLPIITTLTGEVEQLVQTEQVGFACNASTGLNMYEVMKILLDDQNIRSAMSNRGIALYDSKFSYDMVYGKLVSSLENLAKKNELR